jgi:chaperonin GroEL (HSP60 family)
LKSIAEKVGTDSNKIEQVASISANNDAEIGKMIADAMAKVTTGRRYHSRRSKRNFNRSENRRRYAVRQRLFVAILCY